MPLYEFECPFGHTFVELTPIGAKNAPCMQCAGSAKDEEPVVLAERVLSPTRTTFKFADRKPKL